MNILAQVLNMTKYSNYLNGKFAVSEPSYLNLLIYGITYIFIEYVYSKVEPNIKDKFYSNVAGAAFIVISLISCHALFYRIAYYFTIFSILSIPYYIKRLPNEVINEDFNKIFKNKKKIFNFTKIATFCFILMFTGNIIYTNVINNENNVLPYKSIINIM